MDGVPQIRRIDSPVNVCHEGAHVGHLAPRNFGVGNNDFVRNVANRFADDDEFSFDGRDQKIVPRKLLERNISNISLNLLDGFDNVFNEELPAS
jgi:hypothetical protein